MMLYYLDASAWVKRYYREIGTDWVTRLFARHEPLSCATLGYVEVRAALSRKLQSSAGGRLFERVGEQVREDWADFLGIALTDEIVDGAAELAERFSLRAADAVHLASAVKLGERWPAPTEDFAFVASDRALKAAAVQMGMTVLDPEEAAQ